MAQFTNPNMSIVLNLSLLRNEFLSLDPNLPRTENWIPFALSLTVEGDELHQYKEAAGATLTLYEVYELITAMERVYREKLEGQTATALEFYNSEAYFELTISDNLEPDNVAIAVWFNMGSLTGGASHGYDRGYRFDVSLGELKEFAQELRHDLQTILT